jgi:hypothetical protein
VQRKEEIRLLIRYFVCRYTSKLAEIKTVFKVNIVKRTNIFSDVLHPKITVYNIEDIVFGDGMGLWCFNTTFNNISAISWRSVLLVEETCVTGENQTCRK